MGNESSLFSDWIVLIIEHFNTTKILKIYQGSNTSSTPIYMANNEKLTGIIAFIVNILQLLAIT